MLEGRRAGRGDEEESIKWWQEVGGRKSPFGPVLKSPNPRL